MRFSNCSGHIDRSVNDTVLADFHWEANHTASANTMIQGQFLNISYSASFRCCLIPNVSATGPIKPDLTSGVSVRARGT
jgi:hypothetical protein